jgi:uncharacterized protein with HEPN domain
MRKSDVFRLRHMLDAARRASQHASTRSRADLEADTLFADGVIYALLVLGEAAGRVAVEERERLPGIPWGKIVGMRNRLVHGYDDVNPDTVWQVLTHDLPPLIAELERILATKE